MSCSTSQTSTAPCASQKEGCPLRKAGPATKGLRTIRASAYAATSAEARQSRLATPAYWIACKPQAVHPIRDRSDEKFRHLNPAGSASARGGRRLLRSAADDRATSALLPGC